MPQRHGTFVWYELMTTDTAAARAFYGSVVGWQAQDGPVPDMPYTLFQAGDAMAAGMMTLPDELREHGVPPHWLGYVHADDVDATVERLLALGGVVHVEPQDIPGIGRFAVVGDPQGAAFALWKGDGEGPDQSCATGTPGRIGWHELLAGDWQEVFPFYAELFGWTKAEAMDMGEMGVYQLFNAGGQTVGGMFSKPPAVPVPFWLYYFNVENIDAGIERVRSGGGQILMGPIEVPGGGWVIQAIDPQGALFALFGRRD